MLQNLTPDSSLSLVCADPSSGELFTLPPGSQTSGRLTPALYGLRQVEVSLLLKFSTVRKEVLGTWYFKPQPNCTLLQILRLHKQIRFLGAVKTVS